MFGTTTFFALKQSLSGLAERQRVIAGNIANVNTPGYKARTVSFEERLATALKGPLVATPGGGRIMSITPRVSEQTGVAARADGNTVDMDQQMAELADASLRYEAAARILAKKYAGLRNVIMEGRR